ncbi:MAG: hypothetical protein O7I93_03620 [Gemmatimonadetes bacterium]|nr:hypothetical protein [Gemmatimonadota bacterium]
MPNIARHEDGFALMGTLFVMLLISTLVVAGFAGAAATFRTADLDYRNSQVFYAAEGGAEAILAQLHGALLDGVLENAELAAITPPTLEGFVFDSFSVERVGGIVPERITDGSYAGLYSMTQRVEIYSSARDAIYNSSAIMVSAKAQSIPIFQFGVFFEKDLEILNGPPMTFAGWVHSNGNIYLSSNNAWYQDIITTPNNVYHDKKYAHDVKNGVYIADGSGLDVQLNFDSRSHPTADAFRAESDAQFDNRLKTNAYEVDSLKLPLPDGMDPIALLQPRLAGDTPEEQRTKFAWNADWYIEIPLNEFDEDNTDELCDRMNHTRDGGGSIPSTSDCEDIFSLTWEAFWDGREQRYVDVLEIDMKKLMDGGWSGTTEVLYITFTGTPANDADLSGDGFYPAVRLVEGKQLYNPFTFATDHPLYVLGDYNAAGIGNWQPAGLIGDAITILSKGWDDSDHEDPVVLLEDANNTDMYAAILAGHSATPCDHEVVGCAGGSYGGGLENFPRFLERWTGRTWMYRGSLVSMHTSTVATGSWGCCSYYVPPQRDWEFDTRFEQPENLPPGTPTVGNVVHTAFRPVY